MAQAAVLDVDGTLVDTNYQHALCWYRAFRKHDLTIPVWRLHRHVGMGGDSSFRPWPATMWKSGWATSSERSGSAASTS